LSARASSALPALRRARPAGRRKRLAPRRSNADSAAIDTPLHHEGAVMNLRTANRLLSLVSAAFVTLVMLAGVNVLASAEPGAANWAQSTPSAKA
jgi:hypothetical protein